jgi:hypothetical protein
MNIAIVTGRVIFTHIYCTTKHNGRLCMMSLQSTRLWGPYLWDYGPNHIRGMSYDDPHMRLRPRLPPPITIFSFDRQCSINLFFTNPPPPSPLVPIFCSTNSYGTYEEPHMRLRLMTHVCGFLPWLIVWGCCLRQLYEAVFCCLLSVVYCLSSIVCWLLSVVYCLLSVVCCLLSEVFSGWFPLSGYCLSFVFVVFLCG